MKNLITLLCISFSTFTYSGDGNHHAAIFTGVTTGDDSAAETLGVEYEFKLPVLEGKLGLGGVVETIKGDHNASLVGLGLIYHLPHHLKVNATYITEKSHGHEISINRFGMAYDHHIGKYSISPTVNIDSSAHHVFTVYGVAWGVSF